MLNSTLGKSMETERQFRKALLVAKESSSLLEIELDQQKEFSNLIQNEYIVAQSK